MSKPLEKLKNTALATIINGTALLPTISNAGFMEQFTDSTDGRLDASQWILNNAHGFLPVPILITEPAMGVGGAALLFFHECDEQKTKRKHNPNDVASIPPPSVTGVVAAATNNGSQIAGVFHSGNWLNDDIRYLGGFFGANFNLKYYAGDNETAEDFNLFGLYFFQDISFRLGNSHFFLGGDYINMIRVLVMLNGKAPKVLVFAT